MEVGTIPLFWIVFRHHEYSVGPLVLRVSHFEPSFVLVFQISNLRGSIKPINRRWGFRNSKTDGKGTFCFRSPSQRRDFSSARRAKQKRDPDPESEAYFPLLPLGHQPLVRFLRSPG